MGYVIEVTAKVEVASAEEEAKVKNMFTRYIFKGDGLNTIDAKLQKNDFMVKNVAKNILKHGNGKAIS